MLAARMPQRGGRVTGTELIRLIMSHVQLVRVLAYHHPDSRLLPAGAARGFPDLVMVGPGGVLFREVKGDYDTLSPNQRLWGRRLRFAGADWAEWRPCDWRSGRIRAEIRRIAGPSASAAWRAKIDT